MSRHPIYIVDDDPSVRRSTKFLLDQLQRSTRCFADGDTFLAAQASLRPGIVLLDLKMPGSDGFAVQQSLRASQAPHCLIVITGHGDVSAAVKAMRHGAVDFLEKPYRRDALLDAIDRADHRLDDRELAFHSHEDACRKLKVLTPREHDVLNGLTEGLPNKSIAYDLGISPRTVEVHRANLMRKLDARNLSDLLRLAFAAEPPSIEQPSLGDPIG